jgi:uncharacterized protein (UPF0261 family)
MSAIGLCPVRNSMITNAAKPIIAALPFNCSANRLKPNLVTTKLGWTVGCFTMTRNILICKAA